MDSYSHDGLQFTVRDGGPADTGEVAVLLHGFPQDASCWERVGERLHTAGVRTLAPDQRGYSPGARPRGRAAYRITELAADVIGLLDAAGLARAHIVGHDWGGNVAWATALLHPDRVASLTAVSTPHPSAFVWALRHSGQALHSWYMLALQIPWLPERLAARNLTRLLERGGLDRADAARYGARFADPAALTGPMNYYRALALPGGPKVGGPVRVPTTYVWGTEDPFLGRAAAERTARYVAADYEFMEVDGGHWLPERHAEVVADAIVARIRD